MRKKCKGILIVLGVTVVSFFALLNISKVKTHANNIPVLKEIGSGIDQKELPLKGDNENIASVERVLTLEIIRELDKDIHLDRTDISNTNATIWYTMDKLFTEEFLNFVENDCILTKTQVEKELFEYYPEYVDMVQACVDEWLAERNAGVFLTTRPFRNVDQMVWNGHYYVFFYDDQTIVDDRYISDKYMKIHGEENSQETETEIPTQENSIPENVEVPQPTLLSVKNDSIQHPSIIDKVSTQVVEKFNETKEQLAAAIKIKAPNLSSIVDAVIDNYENYGISPYFQLSVFSLESAYGKSKLAREKNNIAGLNAYATATKSVFQNAFSFASKSDCVIKFGKIMNSKTYLGRGLYTLEQIASVYCPPNARNWSRQISSLIDDYKELAKSV